MGRGQCEFFSIRGGGSLVAREYSLAEAGSLVVREYSLAEALHVWAEIDFGTIWSSEAHDHRQAG